MVYVGSFPGQFILEPVVWQKRLSANGIEAMGLRKEQI